MKRTQTFEVYKERGTGYFPPTPWEKIQIYQRQIEPESALALEELCRIYWTPINRYITCLCQRADCPDDLTQGFFEYVFTKKNVFLEARQRRGKFRSFIGVVARRFVNYEVRRRKAVKRGGNTSFIPLESDDRLVAEAIGDNRPDVEFDRMWGRALLQCAEKELASYYCGRGKERLFRNLRPFLKWKKGDEPREIVARRLGISTHAMTMGVMRMRSKYRALLRKEIENTISPGCSVEEELCYLLNLFQPSATTRDFPGAGQ